MCIAGSLLIPIGAEYSSLNGASQDWAATPTPLLRKRILPQGKGMFYRADSSGMQRLIIYKAPMRTKLTAAKRATAAPYKSFLTLSPFPLISSSLVALSSCHSRVILYRYRYRVEGVS
jgi:hypothetical protein